MSNFEKKLLFIGAVIAFIALSPLVVLFAQGNRIDFGSQDLYPTGGLYVKTENIRANFYVDRKQKGRTPRFTSGFEPGAYKVVIKKSGYKQWVKKICILPYKVAVIQNIQLVPETPVLSTTTLLLPSSLPGAKKRVSSKGLDSNGFYLSRPGGSEKKSLYLRSEKNQATQLVKASISEFKLAPDGNKALFWTGDDKANLIWLTENFWLEKRKGQIDKFPNLDPHKVTWHKDSFHIFYLKNSNLYWVEVDDRSGCKTNQTERNNFLLVEGIEDYYYSGELGLFVKKDGQWYEVDLTADL